MTADTYVVSDLHLGHENIIEYCDRPFDSVATMNATLIDNWNRVVDEDDRVIFIGDISVSWHDTSPAGWLAKLNGEVVFIKGNHDDPQTIGTRDTYRFDYGGHRFHCVHYPENIPDDWAGWAIYGHHHNNFPDRFPLFDPDNRRINVSVELTGYEPVAMDRICEWIDRRERLQTIEEAH